MNDGGAGCAPGAALPLIRSDAPMLGAPSAMAASLMLLAHSHGVKLLDPLQIVARGGVYRCSSCYSACCTAGATFHCLLCNVMAASSEGLSARKSSNTSLLVRTLKLVEPPGSSLRFNERASCIIFISVSDIGSTISSISGVTDVQVCPLIHSRNCNRCPAFISTLTRMCLT